MSTSTPPSKDPSRQVQLDMFPSPPIHPQHQDLNPQLQFGMHSPPISPPLQQVPPIPLQSPLLQPELQRPRTPPPIYTPRPTPAHFHALPTSPSHLQTAQSSPRERLTRFAPEPTTLSPQAQSQPATTPSLLPSTEAPASIFPTDLPPRPTATASTYTSYFGFYALPRPFIAARPCTPRSGGAVRMTSLSQQHRAQDDRNLTAEEEGQEEMVDVREGMDEPQRSGRTGRRSYMRWMRKRNIGLVVGVVVIVVLFWILIGVGMKKHDGAKEGESKVVT